MPRRKRSASSNFESFDEDDEDESSNSSRSNGPPIQRNAANARERARMRVLSSAFCRLKTKLPNIPPDTKLSKLDTLRLATIYIQQLKSLLDGEEAEDSFSPANSQSLTWPFTFQQMQNFRQSSSSNNTNGYAPPTADDWSTPKISVTTSENLCNTIDMYSIYNNNLNGQHHHHVH